MATQDAAINDGNGKSNSAAYLPYRTFTSSVESLEHGIPKQIDRTIWRNQAGVVQGQILMAFRFLGFIDDTDAPTPLLHEFVEQKERRKEIMVKVVNSAYARIVKQDLTKMTPKMLDDAFEGYGVAGDTKRKAITFFLKAAKFAEIPMHPLLSSQVRNTGPRGKRRQDKKVNGGEVETKTLPETGFQAANTRFLKLRSGGTVTVTMAYDPFSLSREDRDFVFSLVDMLQGYSSDQDEEEEEDQ